MYSVIVFYFISCNNNYYRTFFNMVGMGFPHTHHFPSFLFMLDALTLSPSSVAACDGELVVFTCTVNEREILWRITTPTRNYDPIALFPSFVGMMSFRTPDGVFKYGVTSYTISSMELVSTLNATATRSLDGTVVNCEGGESGRNETANITLICNVDSII